MVLLSIIIGLVLERCLDIGRILYRSCAFAVYFRYSQMVISPVTKISSYLGLAVVIVCPLIVIGFVQWILCSWVLGLLGFLINLIVFVYCLGPKTLYCQWQAYQKAIEHQDTDQISELENLIGDHNPSHLLPENLMLQAYKRLFAVIFWFALFGWAGALVYRLMSELGRLSSDQPLSELADSARFLRRYIDWIPIRLMGLGFMLVGAFSPAFGVWLRHVLTPVDKNKAVLVQTGMAAIGEDDHKNPNVVAILIERSFIVWIVVVALLTIGHLLG